MSSSSISSSSATSASMLSSPDDLEYGLKGLKDLPLMEQVHRLFHAIAQQYPYKQTNAWKELPIEQKKRMLEQIQKMRKEGTTVHVQTSSSVISKSKACGIADNGASSNINASETGEETQDPFLALMKRRYQRGRVAAHGGSTTNAEIQSGLGPRAALPNVTKNEFKPTPQWEILEDKYRTKCPCGFLHGSHVKTISGIKRELRFMMVTFGDFEAPCLKSIDEVYTTVGEYLKNRLMLFVSEEQPLTLESLVENFPAESTYYARWKEFKSGASRSKQLEEDDDVESEQLIEELTLLSSKEGRLHSTFASRFKERMNFADVRTKEMSGVQYNQFSSGRKACFGKKNATNLLTWLGVSQCQPSTMELLSFLAYDCVGRLVEMAVKKQMGGRLKGMTTPLMVGDIRAVANDFAQNAETSNELVTTEESCTASFSTPNPTQGEDPPINEARVRLKRLSGLPVPANGKTKRLRRLR